MGKRRQSPDSATTAIAAILSVAIFLLVAFALQPVLCDVFLELVRQFTAGSPFQPIFVFLMASLQGALIIEIAMEAAYRITRQGLHSKALLGFGSVILALVEVIIC